MGRALGIAIQSKCLMIRRQHQMLPLVRASCKYVETSFSSNCCALYMMLAAVGKPATHGDSIIGKVADSHNLSLGKVALGQISH